jgi:hypothetical protein
MKNNQESNGIKSLDLLHLFGLIALGLPLFYGATYLFAGNMIISAVITVVLLLALYGCVALLKNQKNRFINRPGLGEYVSMILYVLVTLFAGVFVNHFLLTEVQLKNEVTLQGKSKVASYEAMFATAEQDIDDYGNLVASELNSACLSNDYNTLSKYGAQSTLAVFGPTARISTIAVIKRDQMDVLDQQLDDLRSQGKVFSKNMEQVFTDWQRSKIAQANYEMNERMNEDYIAIKGILDSKDITYGYTLPETNDIDIEDARRVWEARGAGLTITGILLVIINILLLAPYLFQEREREGGFINKGKSKHEL